MFAASHLWREGESQEGEKVEDFDDGCVMMTNDDDDDDEMGLTRHGGG